MTVRVDFRAGVHAAAGRRRADGFLHTATRKSLTPACKFFHFDISFSNKICQEGLNSEYEAKIIQFRQIL